MNTTATPWYTTQFITNGLKHYLTERSYRISEPEDTQLSDATKTVICTKLISKEIIEIRGTINETPGTEFEQRVERTESGFMEVTHLILDMMLSPINFFNSIKGHEGDRCLCLPALDQYREVLERLNEYFASNDLYLKIYLVDQSGSVEIFYLNPKRRAGIDKGVSDDE